MKEAGARAQRKEWYSVQGEGADGQSSMKANCRNGQAVTLDPFSPQSSHVKVNVKLTGGLGPLVGREASESRLYGHQNSPGRGNQQQWLAREGHAETAAGAGVSWVCTL